jgi:hypothetical protein
MQAETLLAHLASPRPLLAISVTITPSPRVSLVTMTLTLQAARPHSSMLAALVVELIGMPRQAEAHLASPHPVVMERQVGRFGHDR